jgi:hypothetical protein
MPLPAGAIGARQNQAIRRVFQAICDSLYLFGARHVVQ